MGVLDRFKSDLAEQVRIKAAEEEAIRKANKAQSDDLARQEREAAEINFQQVTEFLPLLKALSAGKELQGLVRLWAMGRVDKVPQYVADGNYASLDWRKRHWKHEKVGTHYPNNGEDGVPGPIYGNVVKSLLFTVQVRKDPAISFRVGSEEHGSIYAPGWNKVNDWHGFSLDDSRGARTSLVDVLFEETKGMMHPIEIIKKSRFYRQGTAELRSGYETPVTPIRNPLLLRLGFPDFDLTEKRR